MKQKIVQFLKEHGLPSMMLLTLLTNLANGIRSIIREDSDPSAMIATAFMIVVWMELQHMKSWVKLTHDWIESLTKMMKEGSPCVFHGIDIQRAESITMSRTPTMRSGGIPNA